VVRLSLAHVQPPIVEEPCDVRVLGTPYWVPRTWRSSLALRTLCLVRPIAPTDASKPSCFDDASAQVFTRLRASPSPRRRGGEKKW